MAYKYVLVGIAHDAEEPVLYPECTHEEEDYFCSCNQSVAHAMETALKKNQSKIEFIDIGFLRESNKTEDYYYKSWTKFHAKEVYKRYLWKIFVFLYRR